MPGRERRTAGPLESARLEPLARGLLPPPRRSLTSSVLVLHRLLPALASACPTMSRRAQELQRRYHFGHKPVSTENETDILAASRCAREPSRLSTALCACPSLGLTSVLPCCRHLDHLGKAAPWCARRHPPYEPAIEPHVPIRGPRTDRAGGNTPSHQQLQGTVSHTGTAGLAKPCRPVARGRTELLSGDAQVGPGRVRRRSTGRPSAKKAPPRSSTRSTS